MRIVHLIPGFGNTFYCENCVRDNALVNTLKRQGHEVKMLPLYLPLRVDGFKTDPDTPIFFGGINVYLQQKIPLFRKTPRWLDRVFDSPSILKWAVSKAGMTDAEELGETTLSMVKGENGRQAKEVNRLVNWLAGQPPSDVVHLSNVLLIGPARKIRRELGMPVVCLLQDEDVFIDSMPARFRDEIWDNLAERAQEIDAFVAVSNYYKDVMKERLKLPDEKIRVVYSGIDLTCYGVAENKPPVPTIGYLSRQYPEKGLHILVEAFVILMERGSIPGGRLRLAGGHTADDAEYVNGLKRLVERHGLSDSVEFLPNLEDEERREFLRSLSVISVPSAHENAFGTFIVEALASGVPAVQPDQGAFPELIRATGGGLLYSPNTPEKLADALETLLTNPELASDLARNGRRAVIEKFSVERMADDMLHVYKEAIHNFKDGE